jgi:osmoprotectant transport system ATP-binding protein
MENTAPSEGSSSKAATLEFREATKVYGRSKEPAVDALSLTVPAGAICVLVGPSGCGKTTAMRMIDISSGDILLDGESVLNREPAALRREIGYAIQQIGLFPHKSVGDNVGTVPRLLGWDRSRIRSRIDELLDLVGLDPSQMRDRFPTQLSGGQRQRVGVARALAARPRIVLMDEPFGALDPLTRDALGDDFRDLHRKLGLTTVMITHDMTEAILLADRVAVMRAGKLLAQGTPSELSGSDDPYVGELLRTPRRQTERLKMLLPREGAA